MPVDDLGELVGRLQREHDGLEVRVQELETLRQHKRDAVAARLAEAERRSKQAEVTLGAGREERAALMVRQDRAQGLLNRFAGRWWMIRQVTMLSVFACGAIASWPVLGLWKMGAVIGVQFVVAALGLLLIPRRT